LLVDSTPPAITCPSDITIECAVAGGVSTKDPQLSSFFAGASATDDCDDSPEISNDAGDFLALGSNIVTFTASDADGNASSCTASVIVEDTRPSELSVTIEPTILWPPNHTLNRV
jgi:hypothetical protein